MKAIILLICLISFLYSCNNDWKYREVKKKEFINYKLNKINNSFDFKFFIAKKNFGAPVNTSSFVIIEKNNKFYMVNPKYGYSVFEDTTLLLWNKRTMEVNKKGNWVYIKKAFTFGRKETIFKYDTIPNFQDDLNKLDREGVYLFDNYDFIKIGELKGYLSLHDLEEGLYYLRSPGIFYEYRIGENNLNNQ